MDRSLQDTYAPTHRCFGCGPGNPQGLQIKSFPDGEETVCEWTPQKHHEAWDGTVSGGICGTLLDCHSNWTAAWHLMRRAGQDHPPSTVTSEFHVRLKRPTPSDKPLQLRAKIAEISDDRAVVEATISSGGVVTCTCRGVFVAVPPGHPAYHRW